MSSQWDPQVVRHVAHLARLKISDDEVTMYARQLAGVLAHMQQLQAVDTRDVVPTAHPLDVTNMLRDDTIQTSCSAAEALANAPQRQDEFFRVPKVLDQETA